MKSYPNLTSKSNTSQAKKTLWPTLCPVGHTPPHQKDKTSHGTGVRRLKKRSRNNSPKNFERVELCFSSELTQKSSNSLEKGGVEEQVFHLRPLSRFKFWADMSPEEREEVCRERASGELPGMRLPGEVSSSNTEAPPTLGVPISEPEVLRETMAAPPVGFRFASRRQKLLALQGSTF